MTSLDIRSNSTVMKRAEQLKRWEESDTNSAPAAPRPENRRKIKFSSGCVFLAACSSGDKEEVLSLIDNGADINTANVDGLTALHQACIDDNLEMVEFLVEHGADINRQDNEGWTPLHATVSCGFVSIARYLVEHGADVAAVNSDGDLAVDLAVDIQHVPMIEYMQKVVNERNIDLQKARDAELDQMLKDAKQWLRSDASEADRIHPKTGATALHVAAAKGYTKVLSLLLAGRANVDKQDNDGWTPLHAAAHWGQKEAAEMLVDAMADMDIRNYAGQTCIDVAERKIVKFLEELRANNKRAKRRPSSQIRISDAIENHNASSKIIRVEVKPDQTKEHANGESTTTLTLQEYSGISAAISTTTSSSNNKLTIKISSDNEAFDGTDSELSDSTESSHSTSLSENEDEKAKNATESLSTTTTNTYKGQSTDPPIEEDAPWRRNTSARVRTQNESPIKNQVPDKDTVRPNIATETSDVILRRTQSFENDEKFYQKYNELRARIKANSCPTLPATELSNNSNKNSSNNNNNHNSNNNNNNNNNVNTSESNINRISQSNNLSNAAIAGTLLTSVGGVALAKFNLTKTTTTTTNPIISNTANATALAASNTNTTTNNTATTTTKCTTSMFKMPSSNNSIQITTVQRSASLKDHRSIRKQITSPPASPANLPNITLSSATTNTTVTPSAAAVAPIRSAPHLSFENTNNSTTTAINKKNDNNITSSSNNNNNNNGGGAGNNNNLPSPSCSSSSSSSPASAVPEATTTAPKQKMSAGTIFKNFFKSFVPPVRDEESETQRKAHAKRVRETRRSTQGVTLDEIKSAEELVKKKNANMNNNNNNSGNNMETTTTQSQVQPSLTSTATSLLTCEESAISMEKSTSTEKGQRPQTLALKTTTLNELYQKAGKIKETSIESEQIIKSTSDEESTNDDEDDDQENNIETDIKNEDVAAAANNDNDNDDVEDEIGVEAEDEDEEEETDYEDYKSPTITLHSPSSAHATTTFTKAAALITCDNNDDYEVEVENDDDDDDTEVSVNYTIKRREPTSSSLSAQMDITTNVEETIVVNRSAKSNIEATTADSQSQSITSSPFESFEQEEEHNLINSMSNEIEKTDDHLTTTTNKQNIQTSKILLTEIDDNNDAEALSSNAEHENEKKNEKSETIAQNTSTTSLVKRIRATASSLSPLIQQQTSEINTLDAIQTQSIPTPTPTSTPTSSTTTPIVTTPILESPVRLRDKRLMFDIEKRYADAHRYQNDPELATVSTANTNANTIYDMLESSIYANNKNSHQTINSSSSLPNSPMQAREQTILTPPATATATTITSAGSAVAERRPSWRLKFSNDSKFKLEDVNTGVTFPPSNSTIIPSAPAVIAAANQRRLNSVGNAVTSSNQSLNSIGRPVSAPTSNVITNLNSNTGSSSAGSVLSSSDNSGTNEKSNDNSSSIIGRKFNLTASAIGATVSTSSGIGGTTTSNLVATNATNNKNNREDNDNDKENDNRTALAIQSVIQRRRKPKRRSTGVVHLDMDELDPERQDSANDADDKESGSEQRSRSRVGSITASSSTSSNNKSSVKNDSKSQSQTENGEPDYKALWQAARLENDQLKIELVKKEEQLVQTNAAMSRITNATSKNSLSELEKRERRAMERKLSELEEELKQLEFYKAENLRLKEENGALIRVISKLSKN